MPASAAPPATAPAGDTAAFDRLLARLVEEDFAPLSQGQVVARMEQLARLVPPGDSNRDLLYRQLRCDWGFDDDPARKQAFAQDSLVVARAARKDDAIAGLHYCQAAAHEALGDSTGLMREYQAGIAAARRAGDDTLVADGLAARGALHSLLGNQARAVPDLLAALGLYRRAGDTAAAESLLLDVAISYRRMGEFAKARQYLAQNEAHALAIADWNTLVGNLVQQGFLAEDDGRVADARAVYDRALALAEEHRSPYDAASVRLAMAYPALMDGDHRQALRLLDQAEAGFAAFGDRGNTDMIELRRGQAHAGLGRHELAMVHFERAAAALARSGNQRYLAILYLARARSGQALGRTADAYADLERYIELDRRITGAERSQQAQLLRQQFDSDRRDRENSRLASETALRERQVETLLQARRWQWTAMALAGVLVLLLVALVVRQLARMRRLRELAATDPLTGVANRRSIERLGEEAIAAARRSGEGLCVLILDIDHFKRVNDRYGHLNGDVALARVAAACAGALRQFDQLGRIGGEEFLVLLPRTRMEQARQVAERVRASVERLEFGPIDPSLRLSISIGIAELRAGDQDLRALCERADAALYAAKDAGRNRMVVAA